MKWSSVIATAVTGAAIFGFTPALINSASAAELGTGWTYQYDATGDGSGGSAYDIKGMAMSLQGNKLVVALMGGTPLGGVAHAGVTNGTIGWGDMFFNFSGKNFNDAKAAGQLFGVRFAQSNDSSVGLGVYSGVKTTSVALSNAGYGSLQQYYDAGFNKTNTQGTALSTKEAAYNYYGTGAIQNSITAGTKVGNIDLLAMNDLLGMGLSFNGKQSSDSVFGFSFDKSLIGSGEFLANVFLECGNDGVAFSSAAAPEPTTMAGTALGIAAFGGLKRLRRRRAQKSEA